MASAVADLGQHAATKVTGRGSAKEATTSRAVAREVLREDLKAIMRTARALSMEMPGLDDRFRSPRGGDQALINTARAFADNARPLAKQFIDLDMPDDFLEDLDRDIRQFEETISDHEAGKDTHVVARALLERAMEAGLGAVRLLDASVPNRLRDDDPAVVLWERARHVEYRSPRARSEAPESPSPDAPSPATGVAATASAGS